MIQKENFWSDQESAQSIIKEKNILENRLNSFSILQKEYDELNELIKSNINRILIRTHFDWHWICVTRS